MNDPGEQSKMPSAQQDAYWIYCNLITPNVYEE